MKAVRILVADDYRLVRQAIRRLLGDEPGWEIVAEASNGHEAVRLAREHQPDLVVIDAAMPALSGIEATRQITRAAPGTRVLMLSVHDDERYVIEALEAGADGYVLKEAADSELVRAINDVIEGRRFVSPAVDFVEPVRYVPADR
jgi:two-component system, NarL family, response regulator NreC